MTPLSITLLNSREAFAPGEALEGEAAWNFDKDPEQVFLRLFWYTQGKGTEDINVVSEIDFDHPHAQETRPFRMTLPQSPYSFTGRLVSLIWALEMVVKDNDTAITREIVISPFGHEINLEKQKKS